MIKFAEGGFNRVFLLTMEDGFEAIIKIPYKIAGPKHYATASEAVTLHYLHSKGIPVPKVYGYSSSNRNSVGVEYIVMEEASGVDLATSFVSFEKHIFDLPFISIGSMYYKKDVPLSLQATLYGKNVGTGNNAETFCIGPTADYMFWHGKRAGLYLCRGPWSDAAEYIVSIAQKEVDWTRQYGDPAELDFPHNGLFPGRKPPGEYIQLLSQYLALAPFLLPADLSSSLNQPTLRHPDLNPNNIFISPKTDAVSCIIDWQHAIIEPRLLAAGYPRAFENSDLSQTPDLKELFLPGDYEKLAFDAKAKADELYRHRLIFYYYRILNGHLNKAHLEALRDPILLPRQHLVDRAGRQWSGNLMTLKGALIRMVEYWPHLFHADSQPCPVRFNDSEIKEFAEQEELWFTMNRLVEHWHHQICVSEDGWVSNEEYDGAARRAAELRASLVASAGGDMEDITFLEKGWPFRDREETN